MVAHRRFEPLNGQSMAVDETDAQIDAYNKGYAAAVGQQESREDREERWWRAGYLVALLAVAAAGWYIASAIRSGSDQAHSDADVLLRAMTRR